MAFDHKTNFKDEIKSETTDKYFFSKQVFSIFLFDLNMFRNGYFLMKIFFVYLYIYICATHATTGPLDVFFC